MEISLRDSFDRMKAGAFDIETPKTKKRKVKKSSRIAHSQ